MFIAVKQRVLLVFDTTIPTTVRCLVCLKTFMRKHDNQPLSIFIIRGNRDMLLGNELWKLWRWARLRDSYTSFNV